MYYKYSNTYEVMIYSGSKGNTMSKYKKIVTGKKSSEAGWTTAEYILGLIVLAGVVTTVVTALGGRLQGLIAKLPF
jgi:hypothetical protein